MSSKFRLPSHWIIVLGIALIFSAAPLFAATITVMSGADAGGTCPGATCTLRQAILAAASSGDTINFAAGITTINLTSAELLINKNLTINGPGANLLTVQRSNIGPGIPNFRIFHITGNFNVTISGLTITNGIALEDLGGGILNENAGSLIAGCVISGNAATATGAGGFGGGIYNFNGTVTLTNSTVFANSANNAGGIYNYQGSTMNLINCTVSGNSASDGGGIGNGGTANLTNSTVSNNSATTYGGMYNAPFTGTLNLRNTIIARNTVTNAYPDFFGTLTSQGYNLIGNTSKRQFHRRQYHRQST